jgi:sulfite reductase (NADPH) hemoprotein beta-component
LSRARRAVPRPGQRRLAGELTEDQFKPLRLMNGVYLQLHAYMLRVAVPYGTLNSQADAHAGHIARKYDRGYGHFTTRQNIQFNWPKLSEIPDILADLASVEMHAIQTSGNCIRNVTADHLPALPPTRSPIRAPMPRSCASGRPSPGILFLPRKFKIAVNGAERDRAAIQVHDIGLHLKKNDKGEIGFAVYIGGGQGRTPMIAKKIRDFLPEEDLLSYTDGDHARVQSAWPPRQQVQGAHQDPRARDRRRGNHRQVEEEWERSEGRAKLKQPEPKSSAIALFRPPATCHRCRSLGTAPRARLADDPEAFAAWVQRNTCIPHKHPDYASVTISLKPIGGIPGDASAEQMDAVADLAEQVRFDETARQP